jgi:hypothetical protein
MFQSNYVSQSEERWLDDIPSKLSFTSRTFRRKARAAVQSIVERRSEFPDGVQQPVIRELDVFLNNWANMGKSVLRHLRTIRTSMCCISH